MADGGTDGRSCPGLAAHREALIRAALESGAELEECAVLLRHILGRDAVPDLEPLLDLWIRTGSWRSDERR